jgi:hypothetical protein
MYFSLPIINMAMPKSPDFGRERRIKTNASLAPQLLD